MTRVIVHAGFHKTGTSSLQSFLARHRKALAPWLRFYGANDFQQAGARARVYGQYPFIWRRLAFRYSFRRFLRNVDEGGVVVLSRETFSGAMPGHRDWRGRVVRGYAAAAVPLCREIRQEVLRRFGSDTPVEFLFTIRERESWIRSVYGHLVRSIHLKEDFATFRASFSDLIDLRQEAERIGSTLAPCPVHIAALEDHAEDPAGPATAIMRLAGVPDGVRDRLPPARRMNRGQSPQMEAEFLRLNRTGKTKRELKALKDGMIAGAVTRNDG